MLIFFQQLCLLLFLWLLKLVDGLMEIFSAISGITDVTYKGEKVNIIEFLAGDSTVNTIFWCIFILAIGLTCIFTIAALIKNMINSQRNVSTIVGKFFLGFARHNGNAYRPVPDYPYIQLVTRACFADISNREYDEIVERVVQRLRGRLDKRVFGVGVRYITARRKGDFRRLYDGFRISRQMEI